MKLRARKPRKVETTNNEPISEDIFAQYQNERSEKSEGIILKSKK